jgi:hypothetical protein
MGWWDEPPCTKKDNAIQASLVRRGMFGYALTSRSSYRKNIRFMNGSGFA